MKAKPTQARTCSTRSRTVNGSASGGKSRGKLIICGVVASLLLVAWPVKGAFITFEGETTEALGSGFGNVLQVLVLHPGGSTTEESGSVTWDGSDDVLSGDAASQSQTQPVSALTAKSIDENNLLVIFNLNQTGSNPALDLREFVMRFYTSSDGTSFFDALYDFSDPGNESTLGLTPDGQGTGSSGYVFRIHFEGSEATDFFSQSDHRIGMLVDENTPINNTANDGPENFFIGDADVMVVIPEPDLVVLLVFGGLGVLGRRRLN